MPRKLFAEILLAALLIALCSWSPWLTQAYAESRAVDSFNGSWATVIDGCGTNCKGCGVINSKRVPFGIEVTLEYGCGLIPEDTSEYHEQSTGLVSALGTVHRFPKP
ncbi:MAG TPA: hypothetical protein VN653_07955 [Anaerolineales bacterium]|nr:hypothetical protein [Anaerolineales bacterium]